MNKRSFRYSQEQSYKITDQVYCSSISLHPDQLLQPMLCLMNFGVREKALLTPSSLHYLVMSIVSVRHEKQNLLFILLQFHHQNFTLENFLVIVMDVIK